MPFFASRCSWMLRDKVDGSARRVARSKKRSAMHDVLLVFASLFVKLASRCPRVCRLLRELEGRPTNFLAGTR